MADISTIVGVDGSSYTIKDATARGLLNGHSVNKDVPANAAFTDTTYESKQAASGGTDLSLVTTGEKYNWNIVGDGQLSGFTATDLTGAANELKNTLNSEIATRQTYVRPNLLDNWYFVGGGSQLGDGVFPINQREQTTYSGIGYGIDKWKSANPSFYMEILSDYISIDHNRMGLCVLQYCKKIGFVGNTVTFSVLAKGQKIRLTISAYNGNSFVKHFVSESFYGDGNVFKVYSVTAIIDSLSSTESLAVCMYSSENASSPVLYKAVKLELGSEQTLAHNEGTDANPVWVLNEIPDYGEQMLKCCSSQADSSDTYANKPYNELKNIVNSKADTPTALSLTLASGSWSSATPSTQTLSASGVTANNIVVVGFGSEITSTQYDAASAAKLACTAQGAGTITMTAFGTKPTVNIPLSVVVLG